MMLEGLYASVGMYAPKSAAPIEFEVDWAIVAACVTGGLLLVAIVAVLVLGSRHRRLAAEQKGLHDQLARTEVDRQRWAAEQKGLHDQLARTEAERQRVSLAVQQLSRYQTIVDAEAAAATMHAQAQAWATQATAQARDEAARVVAQAQAAYSNAQIAAAQMGKQAETSAAQVEARAQEAAGQLAATARREADRLIAEAQVANTQARASAQGTLAQASADAARIVDVANRRAEEIAGAALEAMRDAKRLEQTAQAMKNVIEGYGDRYVMPTTGLLDDLADEFGFVEAGQRLKAARGRSRDMISDGLAATCEYAEASRRTTAISFVLDAFNGKVDTVLADVRHDNFGTLEQKIRDALVLVNQGGRAFRDARILPEYLAARLDELRWAVVAQELKLKEREEQRQIKERIREEERAQREFERAKKEAEKEEEMLRKALEKARRDVEQSTDEERAKYEQKLLELSGRLKAAEDKNQRAISMAQQTKSGHVYVISNVGSFGDDVYKIGMTRRLEPLDRVHELGDASVPFEFDVHAMIRSDDAPALEHALHQRFVRNQVNKVNPRKEFFRVPLHDVRREVEEMKIDVAWTLIAAARQFRETQATERMLANKTLDEAAWVQQQARADVAPVNEQDLAEVSA